MILCLYEFLTINVMSLIYYFYFYFSEILFVDPTAEEENLATGQLTVVTTDDKLCMVHKPGVYK